MVALGFVGSFGHCVGMCGPLAVAFSLSNSASKPKAESKAEPNSNASKPLAQADTWRSQLQFHGLLNLGRLVSYSLVGAII
ncbi:MAG: sulfite exporter TauE/SafE family protein, partial [Cyanobacteria bacterium P01_F01_bin.153]